MIIRSEAIIHVINDSQYIRKVGNVKLRISLFYIDYNIFKTFIVRIAIYICVLFKR
jgi:hypothetical protein